MGQNDLRYRLNVPPEDESVLQWLKEQKHPSISLRLLIKEDIQRNGFVDVTCRSVEPAVRRSRDSEFAEDRPKRRTRRTTKKAAETVVPAVPEQVIEVPQEPARHDTAAPVQAEQKAQVELRQPAESEVFPKTAQAAPKAPDNPSSITSLFAGGSAASSRQPLSAASMGLLDMDDEE